MFESNVFLLCLQWVVGKNINLPRRMPTGSDIETLISDLTSEMRTQIETLQADTTDFTLIFENRLV